MKKIVIIGGGFAGIYCAKKLLKDLPSGYEVCLINKKNYFLFTPLIHEVATGSLDRQSIVQPIRELLKHKNFRFIKTEIQTVDLKNKKIFIEPDEEEYRYTDSFKKGNKKDRVKKKKEIVEYDYLVLAIGSTTNFYGVKGAEEHTLVLKKIKDTIRIKNTVVLRLEEAAKAIKQEEVEKLLSFIIIGAGATGVELCGELSDMINENFNKNYPLLTKCKPKIHLIHAQKDIIPMVQPRGRSEAAKALRKKNVNILTNAVVTEVGRDFVNINKIDPNANAGKSDKKTTKGKKEKITASTIIWAGGVKPHHVDTIPKIQDDRDYFRVDKYMQVKDPKGVDYEGVYSAGDCCFNPDNRVPQYAQTAIKQGILVAENILRKIENKEQKEFHFHSEGVLVSVGHGYAVGEINIFGKSIEVKGFIPWIMKRTVYFLKLMIMSKKLKLGFEYFISLVFGRDNSEI